MLRWSLALAVALALALLAHPVDALAAPARDRLEEGLTLEALKEVTLDGATLVKGARVRVRAVTREANGPERTDLELADGHVVRDVPVRDLVGKFRIRR
jgi:hypothetical protein